jgi:hypothetical protein
LQRGSDGSARENRRIQGVQQMWPRASPMSTARHFSSADFFATALSVSRERALR